MSLLLSLFRCLTPAVAAFKSSLSVFQQFYWAVPRFGCLGLGFSSPSLTILHLCCLRSSAHPEFWGLSPYVDSASFSLLLRFHLNLLKNNFPYVCYILTYICFILDFFSDLSSSVLTSHFSYQICY